MLVSRPHGIPSVHTLKQQNGRDENDDAMGKLILRYESFIRYHVAYDLFLDTYIYIYMYISHHYIHKS